MGAEVEGPALQMLRKDIDGTLRSAARAALKDTPGTYRVVLDNGSKCKSYFGKAVNIYRRLKDHVNQGDWSWKHVKAIFAEEESDPTRRSLRETERLLEATGGKHPAEVQDVSNKIMPPKP
jgi:hypothetical protein